MVNAQGRSVGDASRLTVKTRGKTVEYIDLPPRAWARDGAGTWVLVAAGQAPIAPLDVLAAPLTLQAATGGAAGATFTATYPAKALGLDGEPLTVTITIDGDAVTFHYEATTSGRRTESTTTIRPGTAEPITAPAA